MPGNLYGDRQQDESGKSFEMQEIYLSEEEVSDLRADGAIIVGYKNSSTPMYEYGPQIAKMEYDKRILSAGVWGGVIVAAIYVMCYTILDNQSKRNRQ